MRIARKLDAVAALVAVVVGLTATCPCLPATNRHAGQAAANEHACCASGASPTLSAAQDCCDVSGLTDKWPATPSAGVSLGADTGFVAAVMWSPSALSAHLRTPAGFVSSPPSILRI